MNKIGPCRRIIRDLYLPRVPRRNSICARDCNTKGNSRDSVTSEQDVTGTNLEPNHLAGVPRTRTDGDESQNVSDNSERYTFTSLLRNSNFIDLGDPEGKIVVGEIFHTVENDLYIDFGWKFHCVCPRPNKDAYKYIRGSKVHLSIKDLELSTRFLGASSDLTILEADCVLLSLVYSPLNKS